MQRIFNFADLDGVATIGLGLDGTFLYTARSRDWAVVFGVNGGLTDAMRAWLRTEMGSGFDVLQPPKSRRRIAAKQWGFYTHGYRHYVLFRQAEQGFAFKLRWA